MGRYFSKAPKAYRPHICEDTWYVDPVLPSLSADDHDPVFTGLLDARGEQIWRAPNPMGFGKDEEW